MLRNPLLTITAVAAISSSGCQAADPAASLGAESAAPEVARPFLLKHQPERPFSSVVARGDLIYLVMPSKSTSQTELRVYDASLVTAPKRVASVGALAGAELALGDSRAYLYSSVAGGQTMLDLSQPRAPALLEISSDTKEIFSTTTLSPRAGGVFTVAGGSVAAIDTTAIDAPREIWKLEIPGAEAAAAALTSDGKTLCLAPRGEDQRILITLAVDGEKPTGIGTVSDAGSEDGSEAGSNAVATIGSFAYFLNQGLRIADVSNPAEPKLVDQMTDQQVFGCESRFHGLIGDGERLLVAGENVLAALTPDASGRLTVSQRVTGIADIAGGQLNRDLAVGIKAAYLLSEGGDLLIVPLNPGG